MLWKDWCIDKSSSRSFASRLNCCISSMNSSLWLEASTIWCDWDGSIVRICPCSGHTESVLNPHATLACVWRKFIGSPSLDRTNRLGRKLMKTSSVAVREASLFLSCYAWTESRMNDDFFPVYFLARSVILLFGSVLVIEVSFFTDPISRNKNLWRFLNALPDASTADGYYSLSSNFEENDDGRLDGSDPIIEFFVTF